MINQTPIWLNDDFVSHIFILLEQHDAQPLFVGGCVRDFYKNLPANKDIDIAVACDIHNICSLLDDHHIRYETIGIDYGTIGLYKTADGLKSDYHIEITALRIDNNYDGRYPQSVNFDNVAIQQDAARRDFTINALYWHPKYGLYDFYNGLEDLHNGKLRFIGDAKTRINEDYLRILRYFRFLGRFAHKDNAIDAQILSLLQQLSPQYLPQLKSARIGHEMMKIFALANSADILALMAKYGILSVIGLEYNTKIERAINYYQQHDSQDPYAILALFLMDKNVRRCKEHCQKWSVAYKKLIFFHSPYDEIIRFARQHHDIHITRLVQDHHQDISHRILMFITSLGYITAQKSASLATEIDHASPMMLPMRNQEIIDYYHLNGDKISQILNIAKTYYLDNHGNINRQSLIDHLNQYLISDG